MASRMNGTRSSPVRRTETIGSVSPGSDLFHQDIEEPGQEVDLPGPQLCRQHPADGCLVLPRRSRLDRLTRLAYGVLHRSSHLRRAPACTGPRCGSLRASRPEPVPAGYPVPSGHAAVPVIGLVRTRADELDRGQPAVAGALAGRSPDGHRPGKDALAVLRDPEPGRRPGSRCRRDLTLSRPTEIPLTPLPWTPPIPQYALNPPNPITKRDDS